MERKLKQYIFVAARGNGKTAFVNKMISRLAEGKCVCCGESVSEGHEICTNCEKHTSYYAKLYILGGLEMTNRTHYETMNAVNIGRAKRMFDNGYSVTDIAAVLQIPESKVREYAEVIETAEKNKEAMEKGS